MASTSCESCTYYEQGHTNTGQSARDEGLCRYNPPVSQPGPETHGLWPVVGQQDWCGHYTTRDQRAAHAA